MDESQKKAYRDLVENMQMHERALNSQVPSDQSFNELMKELNNDN
jgi:hypothetical protein